MTAIVIEKVGNGFIVTPYTKEPFSRDDVRVFEDRVGLVNYLMKRFKEPKKGKA